MKHAKYNGKYLFEKLCQDVVSVQMCVDPFAYIISLTELYSLFQFSMQISSLSHILCSINHIYITANYQTNSRCILSRIILTINRHEKSNGKLEQKQSLLLWACLVMDSCSDVLYRAFCCWVFHWAPLENAPWRRQRYSGLNFHWIRAVPVRWPLGKLALWRPKCSQSALQL